MKYTSLIKKLFAFTALFICSNSFGQNLNIPTLPAGDSIIVISSVTINSPFTNVPSQLSKQHTITGANFSNVLSNDPKTAAANDATVTPVVTVTGSDLSITKTDSPDPVAPGNNLTYTITLSNLDVTTTAATVSVTDALPAGVTFVSLTTPAGWTSTTPAVGGTGTVTITKPSLSNAEGTQTFTLIVNVDSGVASGTVISNTASVTTTTTESNSANNSATSTTTVTAPASDLSIGVTDSPDPVAAGADITYTITLSNLDLTTTAQSVSVSDALPAGVTFVSLTTPAGWTATTPAVGGTGTVTITKPSLSNAEGIQTFTLVVNVGTGVANSTVLSNTATVTTTTTESNSANNTATATTTVAAVSSAGNYFRTITNGNWNAPATWESATDAGFTTGIVSPATLSPDFNANAITVRHNVTVTANVTADQLTVDAAASITVNNGVVFTINDGAGADIIVNGSVTVNSGGNMLIRSTASGTASVGTSTGTVTGNVTVERFISAASSRSAWRLLTAPLTGATNNSIFTNWQNAGVNTAGKGTTVTGPSYSGGGIAGTPASDATTGLDYNTLGYSLKSFDVASQTLQTISNSKTTSLFSGTGNNSYFIFINGDRSAFSGSANTTTLSPTGSLRVGDQAFATSSTADGFTLLGNPYASPVDLNLFRQNNSSSNLKTTYYYWDPYLTGTYGVGGYVTVSYDGVGNQTITPAGAAHTQYLQSGQAMFVQTTNPAVGTASVTFKEGQKSATDVSNIFRTTSGNIEGIEVNLNVMSAGTPVLVDGVVAKFDNSYSAAIDNYDAHKFFNTGESIALVRDNRSLSIERRPLIKTDDVLYLNLVNVRADRSYQFEFKPDFNAPTFSAWLQDNYLKTITPIDINRTSTVNFTVNSDAGSTGANRFSIIFNKPAVVQAGDPSINVYPNPVTGGNIKLQFNNMPQGNYVVRLVNNVGQVLVTKQISRNTGNSIESIQAKGVVKGIYQVEITNPNNTRSIKKVIVN